MSTEDEELTALAWLEAMADGKPHHIAALLRHLTVAEKETVMATLGLWTIDAMATTGGDPVQMIRDLRLRVIENAARD